MSESLLIFPVVLVQVWAECEEATLAASQELRDRLSGAEMEISRLQGDIIQLRALNSLN